MKLLLDFPKFKIDKKLNLNDKIFFLGSCFAENIHSRFEKLGLQSKANPLGVAYNPLSIAEQLKNIADGKNISSDEIVENQGQFFSWDTSHNMSRASAENFQNNYNQSISETQNYLHNANWLIISLGTSKVHELKDNKTVVSNCHKMPVEFFDTRILSQEEVNKSILKIEKILARVNYEAKIIWTVSPVRHIRDGLIENNRSKARLLESMSNLDPRQSCYYPSFEVLIDCLRDYRFYSEDLVHPSSLAVDIIFGDFINQWLLPEQQDTLKDLKKMAQWNAHRPILTESKKSAKILDLENRIKQVVHNWSPIIKP